MSRLTDASRTISIVAIALIVLVAGAMSIGPSRVNAAREGSPSSCDAKYNVIAPVLRVIQFGGAEDSQFEVGCNAFQTFTYLNWRAKGQGRPNGGIGPNAFGLPVSPEGVYTTVWESYVNPDDLFKTPTALRNARAAANGVRTLSATSKADGDDVHFSGFHQPGFGWITSRNGDLTFFEERIDNDEAAYITQNGLTSAAKQKDCAQSGGLSLPDGTSNDHDCQGKPAKYGLNVGSIELKAAWVQLHNPAQYSRYLISRANLVYPDGSVRKNVVIGLVGLHIIRKMGPLQQLSWATFEQVDNDPDSTPLPSSPPTTAPTGSPTAAPAWTYRNTACTGPYCAVNRKPTPCPAPGCQAYTVPTQTQRVVPQSMFAYSSTQAFRRALTKAGATRSVFFYYRLIDVQWPTNSTVIPPGATIPLTYGKARPRWTVANTTLETYFQNQLACLDCHTGAAISNGSRLASARGPVRINLVNPARLRQLMSSGGTTSTAQYASDYSFVFGKAK